MSHDHSAMAGMDMAGGSSCKVSMLWNWTVEDSCFLSASWHITSKGMFAGSCIGVILLVISLEFLRRSAKQYDRHIIAQYTRSLNSSQPLPTASSDSSKNAAITTAQSYTPSPRFRPNVGQQAIRAALHMLQFAVAYTVMLIAMSYNGIMIICIFIGAYLGYFIFQWDSFNIGKAVGGDDKLEEATLCCG